jgi:HipA-like protein
MKKARALIGQSKVGKIWSDSSGYCFSYHKDYLQNPFKEAVSFTLPLQQETLMWSDLRAKRSMQIRNG